MCGDCCGQAVVAERRSETAAAVKQAGVCLGEGGCGRPLLETSGQNFAAAPMPVNTGVGDAPVWSREILSTCFERARRDREQERELDRERAKDQQRRRARNESYELLRLFRHHTLAGTLPRLGQTRWCSAQPIPAFRTAKGRRYLTGMPGTIELRHLDDNLGHAFHGLFRCANPNVCPVCSRKLAVARGQEVASAVGIMIALGYKIAMMTLTASHDVSMNFGETYEAWAKAEAAMRKTKFWQRINADRIEGKKNEDKILYYTIRAVEVTDDATWVAKKSRTGWHLHAHYILFFAPTVTIDDIWNLEGEFESKWIQSLNGQKLNAKTGIACKFNVPKQNGEDIQKIVDYVTKGASYEISGSRFKSGRGNDGKARKDSRRISIWQLQKEALISGKKKLLNRYAEYMVGIYRKKPLNWSKGLRELVGQKEKTDQDIMNEQKAIGEVIWEFTKEEWSLVTVHGAQGRIIDAADAGGAGAVADLLEQLKQSKRYKGDPVTLDVVALVYEGHRRALGLHRSEFY